MENKFSPGNRGIAQAFIFLLLGVFAVFSTLMVLLGAQLYRSIVDRTEMHNDRRVLYSYVINAVRGNDTAGSIRVENRNGVDMLVLAWPGDEDRYETMIYCYEGSLRELFGGAGQAFEPAYGEVICQARAFRPEMNGGALKLYLEDAQGEARTLHMQLVCGQEEAQ